MAYIVCAELMNSCCSANTGVSMFVCPQKNVTYQFVLISLVVLRVYCSSLLVLFVRLEVSGYTDAAL